MRRSLWILTLLLTAAAAQAQEFPNNPDGKLLPGQSDLPKGGGEIQPEVIDPIVIQTLVGTTTAGGGTSDPGRQRTTSSDVFCNGNLIGTVKFQLGGFTGKKEGAADNSMGGMMIRGGFNFSGDFNLKDGHHLGWVQRGTESGTGTQTGLDSENDSPLMSEFDVPGMTLGFADIPYDTFAGNTITKVDFEAVLVCWDDDKPKEIYGLGSFLWGYEYDNANNTIKSTYASTFTPPITQSTKDEFNNEFGPKGIKDPGWTLIEGCDDCFDQVAAPAPGALFVYAIGFARNGLRRRKNGKRPIRRLP